MRHLHFQVYSDYDPNELLKALDVPFIEPLYLHSEDIAFSRLLEVLMGNNTPLLKTLTLTDFDITAAEDMPGSEDSHS